MQGVEQEASGFVVDLLTEQQAHDLHEGDLVGAGVLKGGEDKGGNAATSAVGNDAVGSNSITIGGTVPGGR